MTTVTLKATGTPSKLPGSDAVGSLVGSGGIWADASDASYIDSTAKIGRTTYVGRAAMDVLPSSSATVTSVVAHARAQAVAGTATPAQFFTNMRLASDASGLLQFGIPFADGGWWNPTTGSITDLSVNITDAIMAEYNSSTTTVADLLSLLEAGASVDIGAFAVSSSVAVEVRVYEFSIDITYSEPLELPCDTDVALDLSTAVFLDNSGTLSGQYVDGVITSTSDFLQPDFYIPGLVVDPLGVYKITFTYDPDSSHDGGSREAYVSGLRPGHEQDDVNTAYAAGDEYSDIAVWWDTWTSETGDTLTFVVGPGRGPGPVGDHVSGVVSWDDGTYGVAAGYTAPWFESAAGAALSGITIRKLCTFAVPPLRLINRGGDQFSSAWAAVGHQRTRQGGNRQLGIL